MTLFPESAISSKHPTVSEYRISIVREVPAPFATCDQPALAAAYWRTAIATAPAFNADVECLAVLLLNTKLRVKGHVVVSIGSLNETVAHPREILRPCIVGAAHAFVLMHNHPSGDPAPSEADRRLTARMGEAARLLQINLLDHVIVGEPGHFSFRETGLL